MQSQRSREALPYPLLTSADAHRFHDLSLSAFRRQVFEAVGGIDTTFPAAIDYDLCL
jgi:hypothetical protein